jgi:hypothetical protein
LHVAALALLAVSLRLRPSGFDRDLLVLALLASFPSVVTPQLRIVGLQSFFWLLLAIGALEPTRVRCFRAGIAALLASFVVGIEATKRIFDTGHHDLRATVHREQLYPNTWYETKRDLLIRLLGIRDRGARRLQLDRLLDQHHRDVVVHDVGDLLVLAHQRLGDALLDLVPAAVAQPAGVDLGVEPREQRGGRGRHGLARLGADQDLEQLGVHGHRSTPRFRASAAGSTSSRGCGGRRSTG